MESTEKEEDRVVDQFCRLCGHEADDEPEGSYDMLLFEQEGWTTFGPIEDGLCRPCRKGKEEFENDEKETA